MAGIECTIIWLLKATPLISIILFLYFYNEFFLKNANVHKTTVLICIFALVFGGSLYIRPLLEDEYECRKTDKYKEKVINFTYNIYEYSEYDTLKESCNGFPHFYIISINENDTIIHERKISYNTNDTIEALECMPEEGNMITVWGNCNHVYEYYESFPKSWYVCNGI